MPAGRWSSTSKPVDLPQFDESRSAAQWRSIDVNQPQDIERLSSLLAEVEQAADPGCYRIRIRADRRVILTETEFQQLEQIQDLLQALGAEVELQGELQTEVDVDGLNLSQLPSGAIKEAPISLQTQLATPDNQQDHAAIRAALQMGWQIMRESN